MVRAMVNQSYRLLFFLFFLSFKLRSFFFLHLHLSDRNDLLDVAPGDHGDATDGVVGAGRADGEGAGIQVAHNALLTATRKDRALAVNLKAKKKRNTIYY